jgi:hypothetical protein
MSIFKNVSGNSGLLLSVSNFDYKDWTQLYNDLNLPFEPTGYVDAGVKTFWYKNSQARETGDPYFLNWRSSREPNTMYQEYYPEPERWFSPQDNEIGERSTYKFNKTFLSGSGYGNTGDYFAAFVVAKINSTRDMCLMNFSPNEAYGIYQLGRSLYFLTKNRYYYISLDGVSLGKYYSIGFWRSNNQCYGFVNGKSNEGQRPAIVSDISRIVPCIGGSGKTSNQYAFDGNIAEALVYSSNTEFFLDPKFHYNFNSRFGIINGNI